MPSSTEVAHPVVEWLSREKRRGAGSARRCRSLSSVSEQSSPPTPRLPATSRRSDRQSRPTSRGVTRPAIGSNAARKCCIDCSATTDFFSGSIPKALNCCRSSIWRAMVTTRISIPPTRSTALGPKLPLSPSIIGPSPVKPPSLRVTSSASRASGPPPKRGSVWFCCNFGPATSGWTVFDNDWTGSPIMPSANPFKWRHFEPGLILLCVR